MISSMQVSRQQVAAPRSISPRSDGWDGAMPSIVLRTSPARMALRQRPARMALRAPPALLELLLLLVALAAMARAEDLYCGSANCYEVLGLPNPIDVADEERVTDRDIKKAYRKLSMVWHPDKCREDGCEEKFVEIANAYEVLSDESKRSDYDYALEHPDAVFYNNMQMYRHTYAEKTDLRYVLLFMLLVASIVQFYGQHSKYELLVQAVINTPSFKSVTKAQLKGAVAGETEVALRERAIQQLAANADTADAVPSLLKTPAVALVCLPHTLAVWVKGIPERRAAAAAAAEAAAAAAAAAEAAEQDAEAALAERKAARLAAVKAMKDADDARENAWAEKVGAREAKAAAQRAAEKKAREQEKAAAKAARKSLRKLCESNARIAADEALATDGVEFVCSMGDSSVLSALVAQIQAAPNEAAGCAVLAAKLKAMEEAAVAEARRRSAEAKAREAQRLAEAASRSEFSEEELRLLTQGLKKFPGGTLNRWDKIAEHVGTDRSANEVANQTKKMHDKFAKGKGPSDAGAIQRAAATAAMAKKSSGGGLSDAARLGAAAAAGVVTPPPAAAAAAEKPWSESEQRALEAGLKEFPSSLKDERWVKVAAKLPGRSPEESKKRYKALAKAVKEKKAKTQ